MAAGRLIIEGWMPALDASANPYPGAKITFYENGTTDLATVYADYDLTTPLSNPVVANSAGQFASIFADASLLFSIKIETAAGVLLVQRDDVRAIGAGSSGGGGASGAANILDFGAVGDGETDDTDAFNAAKAASKHVYFPGGYHYILNFSYSEGVFSGATLTDGMVLSGDGETSIISPTPDNVYAAVGCDSGAADAWIEGITIRGLKFLGDIAGAGHSEFSHLVFLSGVKRVLIDNCFFEGAQGDAVILASGAGGPSFERHNFDVIITDSNFDGLLYNVVGGRNPVSIIDVDGLLVDGCNFTRWGQSDMPGGIDFEPDQSFGIVKNVRITNNKFSLSGGNRGHVIFATGNIAAANWENCLVAHNHFAGNTAVCIYSNATIGTVKNAVTITDNTMDDCEYILEKVTGSVFGLIFARNQTTAATSGYGRFIIGDGTATYTVKDWLIADNLLTCNASICAAISDNSENIAWDGNTFRGATQAHIRAGQSSPATTYTSWSMIGNTFVGSPTNGTVQGDGNTTASLNIYLGNKAPAGVTHSFRVYRCDDAGSLFNLATPSTLPSAFPFGISYTRVQNQVIIDGDDSGWLITYKQGGSGEYVWQEFRPFYEAGSQVVYTRKASDLSTWQAWQAQLKLSVSLTPSALASGPGSAEQTFTVTGVKSGDAVSVSPPGLTADTGIVSCRVSADNEVKIGFGNFSVGTPTPASGVHLFQVSR